ncbi:MAG TPA: nuclear transport factor 2 family protein [Dehalococcoidia bacterium]|nr:nuclear transport factor 2 family protein [Dehalococcoidia bacterium]
MSLEDNLATTRAYADAWVKGDIAAVFALYHDDFTLHYFGESPLAGDHVGKAAAVATLGKVQQITNRKVVEVHDIMAGEDHSAILVHEHWDQGGRTLDVRRLLVFHLRDGMLFECWLYDDDQRAVDKFWSAAGA